MTQAVTNEFSPCLLHPDLIKFIGMQLSLGSNTPQNHMTHRPTPRPALANHHIRRQIQIMHDHAGIQLVHDLRPVGQTPHPQLGRGPQEIQESVAGVVPGADLASEGFPEEVVVVEVTVAVGEDGVGGGVDEVEVVEGFEDDDEVVGLDGGAGGWEVLVGVVAAVYQGF
mmetsp:Transcript_24886/g.52310  ORF Transcript_24886/g.52310 Transcript_24886/m.52310 type:complete len:169 (-) Transcript_24886:402-908(-)